MSQGVPCLEYLTNITFMPIAQSFHADLIHTPLGMRW